MAELDPALWADTPTANILPLPQAGASEANAFDPNTAAALANAVDEALEAPHIVMPDGEAIDMADADALITAYERIARMNDTCYAVTVQIKQALAALTDSTAKTRRVAGKERVAVVTMPSATWNNSKLKEAYNAYPLLRDTYLRIESVAVKATEYNKTKSMTVVDNPPLETFLSMVASAEQPPSGNPSVKVEK